MSRSGLPERPSSALSALRAGFRFADGLTKLPTYTIPFIPKPTPSSIEIVPISSPPLNSFSTRSLKEPPKLLRRPKSKKEDTPFNIYSIRVYTFRLLARRAK